MTEAPRGPDEMAADAAFFGLVPTAEADVQPDAVCEVWPENMAVLEVFLRLSTQWRHDPMSGTTLGLDYPAVDTVLRHSGLDDPTQTFRDLQVM